MTPEATDVPPTPPRQTVLVVEPDVRLRTAVADYLRSCGFLVVQAGDGDEALSLLQGDLAIRILFADVAVGGRLDGFGLARWVREHRPGTQVILTSGTARTAREAADLCEEHKILPKPYSHDELARRIRMLLA
jgi:DNA-binding response OmpR family regulator